MSVHAPARLHHLALTVRDLHAGADWYSRVFGVQFLMDAPHPGGKAQVLANEDMSLMFAIHAHDAGSGDTFTETRTGMDHAGFAVPTREALVEWQDHLARHGVVRAAAADRPLTQSPIADEPYGSVLVFRDPDNIQLELYAPPTEH